MCQRSRPRAVTRIVTVASMDPVFAQGLREAKALLDEGILTQVSLCIPHGTRLHSVDNKRKTISVTEPANRKPSDSARETNIERSYCTSIQGSRSAA
jgi:hypothetical protein